MSSSFKENIISEMINKYEDFEVLLNFLIELHYENNSNDYIKEKQKTMAINSICRLMISSIRKTHK